MYPSNYVGTTQSEHVSWRRLNATRPTNFGDDADSGWVSARSEQLRFRFGVLSETGGGKRWPVS